MNILLTTAAAFGLLMGAYVAPASAQNDSCNQMPAGAHWVSCMTPQEAQGDARALQASMTALRLSEARASYREAQEAATAAVLRTPTQTVLSAEGRLNEFPAAFTEAQMDEALHNFHTGLLVRTQNLGPCDVQVPVPGVSVKVIGFYPETPRAVAVNQIVRFSTFSGAEGQSTGASRAAGKAWDAALVDQQRTCHQWPIEAALSAFNGSVKAWFK